MSWTSRKLEVLRQEIGLGTQSQGRGASFQFCQPPTPSSWLAYFSNGLDRGSVLVVFSNGDHSLTLLRFWKLRRIPPWIPCVCCTSLFLFWGRECLDQVRLSICHGHGLNWCTDGACAVVWGLGRRDQQRCVTLGRYSCTNFSSCCSSQVRSTELQAIIPILVKVGEGTIHAGINNIHWLALMASSQHEFASRGIFDLLLEMTSTTILSVPPCVR